MKFLALDVETANADVATICQIGVVTFEDGTVTDSWSVLVDPEDEFDGMNVRVHGITPERVAGAAKFPELVDRLRSLVSGQIVAAHSCFDRLSLQRACERYCHPLVECSWLDTCRVTRRAWPKYRQTGYGLANVAGDLGITFRHHDAAEDARAAGEILLRAVAETSISLEQWLTVSLQSITSSGSNSPRLRNARGKPDGHLVGHTVVFTGALTLSRVKAAEIAVNAGCDVATTVGRSTTLLVVGDQDARKLNGHERSSKHRKVEVLASDGQEIRVLAESDFLRLVAQH